tara:strand:- start:430 stop:597 length:168 start_codon:yes stop_codon:yes gene_type:complete
MNTKHTFDYKPKMTNKQLVGKIKKYLKLDTTKNTNEDAKRYAEQLLEWINIWEKR